MKIIKNHVVRNKSLGAIVPITEFGDPVLRMIAEEVVPSSSSVEETIDNLIATVSQFPSGAGIAAPQIGISHRICIIWCAPNAVYPQAPVVGPMPIINPKIIWESDEKETNWEGCLSLPGIRAMVPRYKTIAVEYADICGNQKIGKFKNFLARVVQHEIDHLNGVLFTDRCDIQTITSHNEFLKMINS